MMRDNLSLRPINLFHLINTFVEIKLRKSKKSKANRRKKYSKKGVSLRQNLNRNLKKEL